MATSPNFGWLEPDNTDLVKNGALAIRTLGNAIDASLVDLKGGTTGQVLAKATNTDMDFTWVAQDDSNAIQNAIVDAKGDIIAATANDTPARLAVGANDLLLTAASGEATGLKYTGGWTAWTPTFTNFTLGNGSILGSRYQKIGKTVNFEMYVRLGSTSSVTGLIQYTLPVNAGGTQLGLAAGGVGRAFDSSTTLNWDLRARFYNDTGYIFALNSAGTFLEQAATSATAPITWATNDEFVLSGTYEVA
jgi:hypothetical protein